MSDEAKAARERRQAKIRAGAADRLAKITGAKGTVKETRLSQPNVPSAASLNQATSAHQAAFPAEDDDPPDQLPDASTNEEDPLFKLLAQVNAQGGASGSSYPALGDNFDLAALLAQQNPDAAIGAVDQTGPMNVNVVSPYWDVLHLVLSIALAVYTTWNPFHLLALFVAMQVVLQATKYQLNLIPRIPGAATLLAYIPKSFRSRFLMLARLYGLVRDSYRDLCVVLFFYGLFHYHSSGGASAVGYRVQWH